MDRNAYESIVRKNNNIIHFFIVRGVNIYRDYLKKNNAVIRILVYSE